MPPILQMHQVSSSVGSDTGVSSAQAAKVGWGSTVRSDLLMVCSRGTPAAESPFTEATCASVGATESGEKEEEEEDKKGEKRIDDLVCWRRAEDPPGFR